jgi:hypothetical protein
VIIISRLFIKHDTSGLSFDGTWSTIANATDISIIRALNTKDSGVFALPNKSSEAYETWKDRDDNAIRVYIEFDETGDTGTVSAVNVGAATVTTNVTSTANEFDGKALKVTSADNLDSCYLITSHTTGANTVFTIDTNYPFTANLNGDTFKIVDLPDALVYEGYISEVDGTSDPLIIVSDGYLTRLVWDYLLTTSTEITEGEASSILAKGIVHKPPGVADKVIKLADASGLASPGFTNDEYNGSDDRPIFLMLRDKTFTETSVTFNPTATSTANDGDVNPTVVGGTWASTGAEDGVSWHLRSKNESGLIRISLAFDIHSATIPKTSTITKIKISLTGTFGGQLAFADNQAIETVNVKWSRNSIGGFISLGSFSVVPGLLSYNYVGYLPTKFIERVITGDENNWFVEGANWWESGFLVLEFQSKLNFFLQTRNQEVHIDFAELEVFYETGSFDQINQRISDTQSIADVTDTVFAHTAGSDTFEPTLGYDAGFHNGGTLTFTSGFYSGQSFTIDSNAADSITLTESLARDVEGETFTITTRYDQIACYDDGTPPVANNFVFGNRNINTYDEWLIVKGGTEVTSQNFADLEGIINDGEVLGSGVAIELDGVTRYEMFQAIVDALGMEYWTDYSTNTPVIRALAIDPSADDIADNFQSIAAASVTYDVNNDPPSWNSGVTSHNNEYGYVTVLWKDGAIQRLQDPDNPSSNPKTKFYKIKYIVTERGARDYALRKARKLASKQLDIALEWDYLPSNIPSPGTKYDYTGKHWNGAAYVNQSFTDEICRQVEIVQDGAKGPWLVRASFGGGSTPPEDQREQEIGNLEKWQGIQDAVSNQADVNTSLNRAEWDDIANKPTAFTPIIHDEQYHTLHYAVTKEPTGYGSLRTHTTITMNGDDFELDLNGVSNYYIFSIGRRREIKAKLDVDLSGFADDSLIYIKIDEGGNLLASTTEFAFGNGDIYIATVYKNENPNVYTIGDERHGITMDWATHEVIHKTVGSRYEKGLAMSFDDPPTKLVLTSGVYWDEDIEHEITGADPYAIPIWYRNADLSWSKTAKQQKPLVEAAGVIQYDQGGVGLTDVPAANHVAYFYYGTNLYNADGTDERIIGIIGQRVDTTLAAAIANNDPTDLDLTGLPTREYVLLYRVIYKRAGAAESTEDVTSYREKGISRVSGASTITATEVNTATTNFGGILSATDVTVQAALDTIDDHVIVDHDTVATGANLNTLVGGGDADALHTHDLKMSDLVDDLTPQLGGDLDLNGNNIDFPTVADVSDCIDDDTMATASATKLATSESIKAYADLMLPLAGGTMAGNIDMNGNNVLSDSTKDIYPMFIPDNGWTSGANNVYFVGGGYGGSIAFGASCVGNNWMRTNFTLPDNYKSGTDVLIHFWTATAADNNLNGKYYASSKADGEAPAWVVSDTAIVIDHGTFDANWNFVKVTLPNASLSFAAGDTVHVAFAIDDDDATTIVAYGFFVRYQIDKLNE